MKIDPKSIGETVEESGKARSAPSPAKVKSSPGASDGDAFASLLLNEVQSAGETVGQDSAVSGPASLSSPWSTQSILQASGQPSSPSSGTITSLNSIFDGLDSLQSALQGVKSPKDINSLIEQINQQAAGLDDKMSGLPANSKLRDLAEETKVAAYMESLKWKRGDYL